MLKNKQPTPQKITITVSIYEAAMIQKLREHAFGSFTIHKLDGEPRRITYGASEMIKEDDALKLLEDLTKASSNATQ